MKKFTAFFLAIILGCSSVSFSFAEDENKSGGILDSIGSFFTNTWNDASTWIEGVWEDTTEWADGAWKDATTWISGAWGNASVWVEQAWNKSSTWVSGIWGDATSWVSNTVSTWWANTFYTVTEDSNNVWAWLQDKADGLKAHGTDLLESAKTAIASADDEVEENVKELIFAMLVKLGINETDSEKVWNTIKAYAEQKGISSLSAAKLSIPYLLQLCADSADQADENCIPAVAVAQYLTGIIEKLGVNDNDYANELVSQLNETLAGI